MFCFFVRSGKLLCFLFIQLINYNLCWQKQCLIFFFSFLLYFCFICGLKKIAEKPFENHVTYFKPIYIYQYSRYYQNNFQKKIFLETAIFLYLISYSLKQQQQQHKHLGEFHGLPIPPKINFYSVELVIL